MRKTSLKRCRTILLDQLGELERHAAHTVQEMSTDEDGAVQSDPNDRASVESERSFDLRLRDRDRKLVQKVKDALGRIETGSYGHCEECGGVIGEQRLLARPVTTQCLECKQEAEWREQRGRRTGG
jgi:DnaK suppressor protein